MTGTWDGGSPPDNVRLGAGTVVTGEHAFRGVRSVKDPAVVIGEECHLEQVQFSLGPDGYVRLGDRCVLVNAVIMADEHIEAGDRLVMGWNSYLADSDFHPLDPLQRIADTVACSPSGAAAGLARPPVSRRAVVIGDDVWIGPACTVLKGVRIGAGAFIEPGSVVTADVPGRARMQGNPARRIGGV